MTTEPEIINQALQMWEQRQEGRTAELARLKAAYEQGMASGESREIDADAFLAELKGNARSGG